MQYGKESRHWAHSLWPVGVFFVFAGFLFLSPGASADFESAGGFVLQVFIDDESYGSFPKIQDLHDLISGSDAHVTLKRDFVTSRSLAAWAKSRLNSSDVNSIQLELVGEGGRLISRWELRDCKVLSAEVSAASVGGYHEKVVVVPQQFIVDL